MMLESFPVSIGVATSFLHHRPAWVLGFYGLTVIPLGMGTYWLCCFLRYRRFPVTNGIVQSKQPFTSYSHNSGRSYGVKIAFTYTVAGQIYTSNKLYSLGNSGWASQFMAERNTQTFEVGQPVQISYDPANPGFGFIRNGPVANIYFTLAGGIVLWPFILFLMKKRHW